MTHLPPRQVTIPLAVILLLGVFPCRSNAQTPAPKKADVLIYVIEASKEGQFIDPQIERFVKDLQESLQYSSYRLISKISKTLRPNEQETVSFERGEMHLELREFEGRYAKLKVSIEKFRRGEKHEILDTEYRTTDDHPLMIAVPSRHKHRRIFLVIIARW